MAHLGTTIEKLSTWLGQPLQARDGEIGRLHEIYFDDARWQTRYFVVRTGSWLHGRDVLVAPSHVVSVDTERRRLGVDLSRPQVRDSPPIDRARPVSRHYEAEFQKYYGLAPSLADPMEFPLSRPELPVVLPAASVQRPERPHLRSSAEVCGYHLHASDGRIGHVEDLLIEVGSWRVRFLEVGTRNWWPGRHVLMAPAWIERVSWGDREVFVKVSREAVQKAPEYDRASGIGPDDEIRLFEHYGQDVRKARTP